MGVQPSLRGCLKSRICYPIGEATHPKTLELALQINLARAARYPFQTPSKAAPRGMTMDGTVDWTQSARQLFKAPKPTYFTNAEHCCECAEHNQTLLTCDLDSIGLRELGNPAWDPLCFSTPDGVLYYFPALVRLTLATISTPGSSYLDQLVFHLIGDGPDNRLVRACTPAQRQFVADFLAALIEHHSPEIEATLVYTDDILIAHAIWQG